MNARVYVTLKPGVLDPQGKAIQSSLHSLGFEDVQGVRLGKYFEVVLSDTDPRAAEASLARMCEKLLANTVIENYRVEIVTGPGK